MRSAHKATAVISNGAFQDDMTSARPARASSGARQARAPRHGSTCRLSSGCLPDLITFLAVMRSARKALAVFSNGAFHDDMTIARPARASSGARQERASRHGSTCQLSMAVYWIKSNFLLL